MVIPASRSDRCRGSGKAIPRSLLIALLVLDQGEAIERIEEDTLDPGTLEDMPIEFLDGPSDPLEPPWRFLHVLCCHKTSEEDW
jgi:hypothetical protein